MQQEFLRAPVMTTVPSPWDWTIRSAGCARRNPWLTADGCADDEVGAAPRLVLVTLKGFCRRARCPADVRLRARIIANGHSPPVASLRSIDAGNPRPAPRTLGRRELSSRFSGGSH